MDEVTGAPEDEALARAVHAVYAVEPAGFVATRKEWVQRLRSEGLREVAKQVSVLRKPSVSAAAVNARLGRVDIVDPGDRERHILVPFQGNQRPPGVTLHGEVDKGATGRQGRAHERGS